MIELRWVVFGRHNRQLEYRVMLPSIDASGAFCPGPGWSDWKIVSAITGEEAALDDLAASGGLWPTPPAPSKDPRP